MSYCYLANHSGYKSPQTHADSFVASILSSSMDRNLASHLVAAMRIGFESPVISGPRGRSTLNDNGAPIQVCIQATRRGVSWGLIGDPEHDLPEPGMRLAASRQALPAVLTICRATELTGLIDQTLETCLPLNDATALQRLMGGVVWIAGGLDRAGAGLYVDIRHGDVEANWDRIGIWLAAICPDTLNARPILQAVRPHGVPAGIGLKGVSAANARAKFYWRLKEPVSIETFGIDPLLHPALPWFLEKLTKGRPLSPSALTFSAGFDVASGHLRDAKIDVCCCRHCLGQSSLEILDVLELCAGHLGLDMLAEARAPLSDGLCQAALLGLGADSTGELRLNLYLKPNDATEPQQ